MVHHKWIGHLLTLMSCLQNIWSSYFSYYYSCGLLTTSIEYSCLSVCVCVCLCVFLNDNSKSNGSIYLKLEHIVVYENSSNQLGIVRSRPRSRCHFSPLITIQTVKSFISALAQVRKL